MAYMLSYGFQSEFREYLHSAIYYSQKKRGFIPKNHVFFAHAHRLFINKLGGASGKKCFVIRFYSAQICAICRHFSGPVF